MKHEQFVVLILPKKFVRKSDELLKLEADPVDLKNAEATGLVTVDARPDAERFKFINSTLPLILNTKQTTNKKLKSASPIGTDEAIASEASETSAFDYNVAKLPYICETGVLADMTKGIAYKPTEYSAAYPDCPYGKRANLIGAKAVYRFPLSKLSQVIQSMQVEGEQTVTQTSKSILETKLNALRVNSEESRL